VIICLSETNMNNSFEPIIAPIIVYAQEAKMSKSGIPLFFANKLPMITEEMIPE